MLAISSSNIGVLIVEIVFGVIQVVSYAFYELISLGASRLHLLLLVLLDYDHGGYAGPSRDLQLVIYNSRRINHTI